MYIIVRQKDNVVIGTSTGMVDKVDASKRGNVIYEIDDSDFSVDLLGSVLEDFDIIK